MIPNNIRVVSANAYVGGFPGGVTGNGMRSEPALFAKCPEALVGLLVCEKMSFNEAILISGTRTLARHGGYAEELTFEGPIDDMSVFGGLLIVDALDFRKDGTPDQWSREGLDRELTKLYAGIQLCGAARDMNIFTSHWGAGAFGGRRELKFLLQQMVVS
jgi:hypothetical protein